MVLEGEFYIAYWVEAYLSRPAYAKIVQICPMKRKLHCWKALMVRGCSLPWLGSSLYVWQHGGLPPPQEGLPAPYLTLSGNVSRPGCMSYLKEDP